jgi:hypothetical protein
MSKSVQFLKIRVIKIFSSGDNALPVKNPSSDDFNAKNHYQVGSAGVSPNPNSLNYGTPLWNAHTNIPPVYSPNTQPQMFSMSPAYQQQLNQQPMPQPSRNFQQEGV